MLSETKFQNWRALAIDQDGVERLVFVGHSSDHVRTNYGAAFRNHLTEDEQESTAKVVLERWSGVSDQGKWTRQDVLKTPHDRRNITVANYAK